MDRKFLRLAVATLIVSVFAVGGNTWAGSLFIPIEGTGTMTTVDPGVQWTDDDGVTHIRGMVRIGDEVGQDADGIPVTGATTYVVNMNIDMATGDGDYSSKAFGETTYGDLTGSMRGSLRATITAFVYDGTYNYPKGYGDFAGWKHRGTFTTILGIDPVYWEGVLHVPGGGDGDKAAATEAETWSKVKDLFR